MPLFSVECVDPASGATSKRIVSAATDGLASQICQRRGYVTGDVDEVEPIRRGPGSLLWIAMFLCIVMSLCSLGASAWLFDQARRHNATPPAPIVQQPVAVDDEVTRRLDTLTVLSCLADPQRIDRLCRDIGDAQYAESIRTFVLACYERERVLASVPRGFGGGVPLELANSALRFDTPIPPIPEWPRRSR